MKKYQCTLPRDIVDYIRGFTDPDHWYASTYVVRTYSDYFQERICMWKKNIDLETQSRRIFFHSPEERNKFDLLISTLDQAKRDHIFVDVVYNSRFSKEIPSNRHEGWYDQAIVYNTKNGLHYVSHSFNIENVPFLYDTATECIDDIVVPLIKYDQTRLKRKRGECMVCHQECPHDLDECVNCVSREKGTQVYKVTRDEDGKIVRWTW